MRFVQNAMAKQLSNWKAWMKVFSVPTVVTSEALRGLATWMKIPLAKQRNSILVDSAEGLKKVALPQKINKSAVKWCGRGKFSSESMWSSGERRVSRQKEKGHQGRTVG